MSTLADMLTWLLLNPWYVIPSLVMVVVTVRISRRLQSAFARLTWRPLLLAVSITPTLIATGHDTGFAAPAVFGMVYWVAIGDVIKAWRLCLIPLLIVWAMLMCGSVLLVVIRKVLTS